MLLDILFLILIYCKIVTASKRTNEELAKYLEESRKQQHKKKKVDDNSKEEIKGSEVIDRSQEEEKGAATLNEESKYKSNNPHEETK